MKIEMNIDIYGEKDDDMQLLNILWHEIYNFKGNYEGLRHDEKIVRAMKNIVLRHKECIKKMRDKIDERKDK